MQNRLGLGLADRHGVAVPRVARGAPKRTRCTQPSGGPAAGGAGTDHSTARRVGGRVGQQGRHCAATGRAPRTR